MYVRCMYLKFCKLKLKTVCVLKLTMFDMNYVILDRKYKISKYYLLYVQFILVLVHLTNKLPQF
jgi:hypothetical protein